MGLPTSSAAASRTRPSVSAPAESGRPILLRAGLVHCQATPVITDSRLSLHAALRISRPGPRNSATRLASPSVRSRMSIPSSPTSTRSTKSWTERIDGDQLALGELAANQSPSPGSAEKYLSNLFSTPSYSAASAGGSFLAVILGHFWAYSVLIWSHFSSPGSVSGLIASAGHSGSQTPQSIHSAGLMTSMFSPS